MTHTPKCRWERTTEAECGYRATHHYCPHPEHACDCASSGERRDAPAICIVYGNSGGARTDCNVLNCPVHHPPADLPPEYDLNGLYDEPSGGERRDEVTDEDIDAGLKLWYDAGWERVPDFIRSLLERFAASKGRTPPAPNECVIAGCTDEGGPWVPTKAGWICETHWADVLGAVERDRVAALVPQPVRASENAGATDTVMVDGVRYEKRPITPEEDPEYRLGCFNNPERRVTHRCMACDNGFIYAPVSAPTGRASPTGGTNG